MASYSVIRTTAAIIDVKVIGHCPVTADWTIGMSYRGKNSTTTMGVRGACPVTADFSLALSYREKNTTFFFMSESLIGACPVTAG